MNEDYMFRVEVQFPIKVYNIKAKSPNQARMKVINEEEDIPMDAVVSVIGNGVLI